MKKPLSLFLLAGALLAAVGFAWWWRQTGRELAVVTATLPPAPDLSGAAEMMRQRFLAAEARTRQRWSAKPGLAELARLYHANGFLDEASRCYGGLEQLAPSEPRWPHLQATILAGFGEIEPAVILWRRVIELAPDYVPARLRLGDCLLKSNQADAAAAAYLEALKLSPSNAYALLGLARIDLEAGRWNEARERLETVVRQTNFELGYDLIVSLYERLGEKERAAAIRGSAKASGAYRDAPDPWLDELTDVCFDPYRLALAAGVAGRTGKPAQAVRLLERAIEIAPQDVSSHFQLGTIAEAQRNFALAREQLEQCISLAPEFADGWAHLSAVQAQQGENSAAARTLLNGLSHCPDSPGLHLMRARRLREGGQSEEALGEFQASIRLRPNEPEAYLELGNTLIELGRENEGLDALRGALEADPGDPTALGILTFSAIASGNEAEARRWFARLSLQPRVPRDKYAQLTEVYQKAFGHPWVPDRTGP